MQQEANILANKDIYDYSNELLGGLDNVIYLVNNNSYLGNINADLNNFVGQKLRYDDIYYSAPAPQIQLTKTPNQSSTYTINGLSNQCGFDICLQNYGSLNNYVKMITDSGFVSTQQNDINQKTFTFNTSLVDNNTIAMVVSKKNYKFATGLSIIGNYLLQEDGFDFLLENNTGKIELEN